ncbi:MAG: ribbon-helix-helix protein, CopG family [Acidimicrobiia bacterium]|nr:ribbon-helix-helix protein, CopG family [Acidimicrobiia bacterium]
MRTIIELPQDQLTDLDGWCRREGISRAEAIRRAVAAMLAERAKGDAGRAFGLWRGRATEALAEQERIRNEWR